METDCDYEDCPEAEVIFDIVEVHSLQIDYSGKTVTQFNSLLDCYDFYTKAVSISPPDEGDFTVFVWHPEGDHLCYVFDTETRIMTFPYDEGLKQHAEQETKEE